MDATKFADGFSKRLREVERVVTRLEKKAGEVADHQNKSRAVEGDIEALESKRAALQSERDELKGLYAEASFECDTSEIQRISKRRAAIDHELEQVGEDIRSKRESLVPVDSGKAAGIVAELDTVKLPNVEAFLDELRFALEVQTSNIRERVSVARDTVPSVWSTEEYDAARAEKDERYRRYLEREAQLAQQDKARLEQMSPISDSSSMADAMNGKRNLEPSVTATSAGDDSGVLSGDEVRAILAKKQAS